MLRPLLRGCVASALALSSAACGADSQFLTDYAGDPYMGRVRAIVYDGSDDRLMTRRGEGSAVFEPTGGNRARLVVTGVIDGASGTAGDASFAIDGTYGRDGWTAQAGEVEMRIADDGRIEGGGASGGNRYAFSGRARPGRMLLTVELTPLDAGKAQVASRFKFDYTLSREAPEGARDMSSGAQGEGGRCRSIRYEMRPVASIGDGTMSMLRVPVCLK